MCGADEAANQNGAVALLVIVVLGKLVVALLVSWLVARTLLRMMIRIMRKWVHDAQSSYSCCSSALSSFSHSLGCRMLGMNTSLLHFTHATIPLLLLNPHPAPTMHMSSSPCRHTCHMVALSGTRPVSCSSYCCAPGASCVRG